MINPHNYFGFFIFSLCIRISGHLLIKTASEADAVKELSFTVLHLQKTTSSLANLTDEIGV